MDIDMGKFIALEGGEGSGKDTQIERLKEKLSNREDIVFTRAPGGTEIGKKIRELLLSNSTKGMVPETELLLFSADRAQHMEQVVKPVLNSGKNIISNRFGLSTAAYQIYGREKHNLRGFLANITKNIIGEYHPFYIILDIDPKLGLERVNKRTDENTRFDNEKMEFHKRVRQGFLDGVKEYRHAIVDASKSVEEIHKEVWAIVDKELSS